MLFLDHKMRELEVHNVTKWQPEKVAELLVSRGFKEEHITADHPGFKESEEIYERLKSEMPKEEYERLIKEAESLMGDPNRGSEPVKVDENVEQVFFDPEEEKKYKDHEENNKKAELERQK